MPGTKEIALVQIRRGLDADLPDALEEGEFGFSRDTGSVYVGAPNNPLVDGRERGQNNVHPYENIQLLTEISRNTQLIKYAHEGNFDLITDYPAIIEGMTTAGAISVGDEIEINAVTILLSTYGTTLDDVVRIINESAVPGIAAANINGIIRIISNNGDDIAIQNITGTPLQTLQILPVSENARTFTSAGMLTRPLQAHLDDEVSIKAWGVSGDGVTDDSLLINTALANVYTIGTDENLLRTLEVPAGRYILEQDSVYLPRNARLIGKGYSSTVFQQTHLTKPVLSTMDSLGRYSNTLAYGTGGALQAENIYVEGISFEHDEDVNVAVLDGISSAIFKNCKFRAGNTTTSILITIPTIATFTTLEYIIFDNCVFENAFQAFSLDTKVEFSEIKNSLFTNIDDRCVDLIGTVGSSPENFKITNNIFRDVSIGSNLVIYVDPDAQTVNISRNTYDLSVGVVKSTLDSRTSETDDTFEVTVPAASTVDIQIFNVENCVVTAYYTLSNLANSRAGEVSMYVNSSILTGNPITVLDSHLDVNNVWTALKTVGGGKFRLQNTTGAATKVKLSYKYYL